MNLSKITAGLAVSFCLVSHVALADSNKPDPVTTPVPAPLPTPVPAPLPTPVPAPLPNESTQNIGGLDGGAVVGVKDYSKSLEEKAREKFNELYVDLNIEEMIKQSEDDGYLGFEGDNVPKFFDFIGYGEAINRLRNTSNNPDKFNYYYPLKLLNDEINDDKKQIHDNMEGIKAITNIVGNVSSEKANSKDVEKNTANIKVNSDNIEKNMLEIKNNIKSIQKNTVGIEVNKQAVADLFKHVGKNINDIDNLKKRVDNLNKDLRRGLATQSALNGLFQPYNVGKVSLTAAVGGYQSNSAIAIGTGYRFNENIAAKAGLSKSVGGSALSYSVGVNYEF